MLPTFFAFLVSASFTALNGALYVNSGSPWSLGAAIFCGLIAVFNLVVLAVNS